MKRSLLLALWPALAVSAFAQTTVYEMNAATIAGTQLAASTNTGPEWGDQVTLAGTARTVTELRPIVQFNDDGNGRNFVVNITYRLRSMGASTPDGALWSATFQYDIAGGAYFAPVVVPDIVVPDTVVWSVQFERVSGNSGSMGLQAGTNVATGSSDPNFFWGYDGTTWTAFNFGADPRANLAARIQAVPEPASLAALTLGAAALLRRRRRH